MSFALRTRPSHSRGLTLMELLVAVAITLAFLGSAVMAFIEIIHSSDRAQARLEAMANARHALETMTIEFKRAQIGPSGAVFQGATTAKVNTDGSSNGNYTDDDGDGRIDEEDLDGRDQDGDWVVAADDKHAVLDAFGAISERHRFRGLADLDDGHVDEDCKFSTADVTFRTFPDTFNPTTSPRQVRFYLGEADGEPNVLLRELTLGAGTPNAVTYTDPIAFNVLSFGVLFWDQNTTQTTEEFQQYWKPSWDASAQNPSLCPLPPSVYLSMTMYAGTPLPFTSLAPGTPIETVTMSTAADIEAVLADPRYAQVRETY